MDKKVGAIIYKLERVLQREVKKKPSPGKPNEYLQKSDADLVNMDKSNSNFL